MAKIEVAGRQLQNSDFAGFIAGHLFIHYLDGDGERFVIDAFTNGEPDNELYVASSGGNYLTPFESYEQQFESITDFVEIDVGDRSVENVIFVMEQLVRAIDEEKLPYDNLNQNSNSTAALLLDLVGVEVDDLKPNAPGAIFGFPGHDDEISLNYQIQGTDDHDVLVGRGGSQSFLGSSGNDSLSGGADADRLTGGEGKDLFFGAPEDLNGDTIVDFEIGDRIQLKGVSRANIEDDWSYEVNDDKLTLTFDEGLLSFEQTIEIMVPTLGSQKLGLVDDEEDATFEIVEGTTLTPDQDFYTGTTSNGLIFASWTRDGDLSFEIDVLNDGTTLRPSRVGFEDSVLTMPSGLENFEYGGVDLRSLTGSQEDVLIEVVYSVSPDDSPSADLVTFTQDTIRYLFIGDGVDDRGGGVWGDPHLLTFDNVGYDFQAGGEFVLAHAKSGDPYIVQARFVAISSAASVTEAIGTLVDGSTVTVEVDEGDGTIVVDGVVTEFADGASSTVGAGTISRDGDRIQIDHGNGDLTLVTAFTTFLSVAPQPSLARDPGSLEGLLGNGNGTPADDFQLSDGSVLTTPVSVDTLYGDFADSWRVQPADRLLPGDPEPFSAPERIITLDSIPQDLREQAEAAVNAMAITNPILRDAAILDFALTGDEQFIEASQLVDEAFDPLVDTIAVDPVSNPAIVLSAGALTIDEDDPATRVLEFSVSRGATVGDVTVNFSVSGIGASPTDADDFVGNITSGSVQIPDGAESQTFTLEIANDALDEGTENFSVSIEVESAQAAEYEVLVSSVNIAVSDDDKPVNTAPTDIDLSPASVDENTAAATVVGALTVTDPDAGDTHTLTLADDAGGLFALDGSDIVVAAGAMLDFEANASHTVTVRATDAGRLSVDQDIEIPVNDVNEAPDLPDRPAIALAADGLIEIDALDGASDPEGDPLTLLGGSDENGGAIEIVEVSGRQILRFTPADGFLGDTVVTFDVGDDRGNVVTGAVTLNVGAANRPPEACPDSYATEAGQALNVTVAQGLLANDSDPDGEDLSVSGVEPSSLGTLEMQEDGAFSFIPDPDASGREELSYTLSDGTRSAEGSLTLIVLDGTEHDVDGVIRTRDGDGLAGTKVLFRPDDHGSQEYGSTTLPDGSFSKILGDGEVGHLSATRAYDPATDPSLGVSDALDVLRIAVGLDTSWGQADAFDLIAADIDRNGDVSVFDALEVLRHAVGLEAENGPEWVFIDDDMDLSHIDSSNVEYETGIDVAPVNADLQPSMTGVLLGQMDDFS